MKRARTFTLVRFWLEAKRGLNGFGSQNGFPPSICHSRKTWPTQKVIKRESLSGGTKSCPRSRFNRMTNKFVRGQTFSHLMDVNVESQRILTSNDSGPQAGLE